MFGCCCCDGCCCGGGWLLLTILVVLLGFWTNLFLIAGGCGLFDLVRCAACCGCWAVGLGGWVIV